METAGVGEPATTYDIVDSATPLIVKAIGVDSDALPLTNSIVLADSAQYVFNMTQDSSVFTFTPKTLAQAQASSVAGLIDSNSADISVTFKVTDGISILSKPAIITYQWIATGLGQRNMFGASGMLTLGWLDGVTGRAPYRLLTYDNAKDPGYFMCTAEGLNPTQGDDAPVRTYRVNATGTDFHTNANSTGATTMPWGGSDTLVTTRHLTIDPQENYLYGASYNDDDVHRGSFNGDYTNPVIGSFSVYFSGTDATRLHWGGTLGHDGNAIFMHQQKTV